MALEGSWQGTQQESAFHRASSIIDMVPQTEEEKDAIRNAVGHEGVLLSLLDVLRRVPRRVLMVLKLNDLTRCEQHVFSLLFSHFYYRSLDHALMTTHSNVCGVYFHGIDVYLTNSGRSESSLLLLNIVHMQLGKRKDSG